MQFPQVITSDDKRVQLKVGPRRASLHVDRERLAGFDVHHEERLSTPLAHRLEKLDPNRWLIAVVQAAPDARRVLRELGLSYATAAGEIYVHAPPVHIEVPAPRRLFSSFPRERSSSFSLRGSRVSRWLLLNLDAEPTIGRLSAEVDLSPSVVSRTVHGLADEALVRVASDLGDSRMRRVSVPDPGRLLEAFVQANAGRRISQRTWDIGSRNPTKALDALSRYALHQSLPHAVGGLAGAALMLRAVEPASIDVWIQKGDLAMWTEGLDATPAQPAPGTVTFRAIPDPFVLSMAWESHKLSVADPVQLYLDCSRAGERAIDAAEAIKREMRW